MQKSVDIRCWVPLAQFSVVILCFLVFSCSQNEPEQSAGAEKKESLKPPVTKTVKSPKVTLFDTCPPPLTITIPSREQDSFVLKANNSRRVIHAPETKPGDFSVLMESYSIKQGLGADAVKGGCIDKRGNLWFATFGGGISRYDGKSFTNYTSRLGLINSLTNCVLEDKEGNLWIGTNIGLSNYNGRFFTNYTVAQGLVNNSITCILQDKTGNFWIGTYDGVSYFDGRTFKNYTVVQGIANNYVRGIAEDKSGNLWFATAGGVSRLGRDDKSFTSYTTANGLVNNYVSSILEDTNGNIWIGTGGGINHMDINGSFASYTPPAELAGKNILSIHEDKKGGLWFGTYEGVYHLKRDGTLMNLNASRGLVNNTVNSIVEDRSGNLWFCTEEGISRFDKDGKYFMSRTTNQGLASNSVWSICEDKKGNLWFGTVAGGVSCLNPGSKTFTNYSTAQGLASGHVRGIFEDKDESLWFGTGDGLCQLDKSRKVYRIYTTLQGLPENNVRCITEDKAGNIWAATSGTGVFRLDRDRKSVTTFTSEQGLPDNSVRNITEDRNGNIWFATIGQGISRLNQDYKSFTNFSTDQGLLNNTSWSILEDENANLWVSTGAGISRFDGKSFANYNSTDGLLDDDIRDMVRDTDGLIWIGTNKGFSVLKGFARAIKQPGESTFDEIVNPDNKLSNAEIKDAGFIPVFEIYDNKTGYLGKGVNTNAMAASRDGTIWAGTGGFLGDKLISFNFSKLQKDTVAPVVILGGIKVDNEILSWYDIGPQKEFSDPKKKEDSASIVTTSPNVTEEALRFGKILSIEQRTIMQEKFDDLKFDSVSRFYHLPVNLVLPYSHNNVTFEFAAIEPAQPYLVRYQYMLEGYDKGWNPVTDQTTATFGNIHEGRYIFKLKAQAPNGTWTEPVTYSFKVNPPWWRSWWAYSLYVIIFLVALWTFIKWRVGALKREKNLLEEKVAKRTNELKEEKEKVESTLHELKSAQAQLIQSEKMASLGELTAGIAHEIQNPLNFVNNFSEVNKELLAEMNDEIVKGNYKEAATIAKNVIDNQEKINHHGKRAEAIVKGMLQHSRTSSGQKELTDINALCDEYLRLAYHGLRAKDKSFNAKLETDFDASIGKINVEPQDIGRVILNLINNAFYATAEKQKRGLNDYEPIVTVKTLNIPPSRGGGVLISVRDNGPGIPQKILDKIFQPFFTTKPTGQGTGLGLSLAYDSVKAHGGEIKVKTKDGEGSEFIIQLPLN